MKKIAILFFSLLLCGLAEAQQQPTSIPFSGNAYRTNGGVRSIIRDEGVVNWRIPGTVSLFFHLSRPETVQLALRARGHAQITVQVEEQTFPVVLDVDEYTPVPVGNVRISKAGYVRVDISSVSKDVETGTFCEISDLLVTPRKGVLTFVTTLSRNVAMTGPALYLNYQLPEGTEWFYSEITVPQEGEQVKCFYVAAGFDCGYIGLYAGATARREVALHIWNPDRKPSERVVSTKGNIRLIGKDSEVVHEEVLLQSESSCKLSYPWKAGERYRFLTHIHPDESGNAVYSAYFYHPEHQKWVLIGSYLRPQSYAGYTYCFSMLKNASPEFGYRNREMCVNQAWAWEPQGGWKEIAEVMFTTDIPGISTNRMDFKGGIHPINGLFLKSGGFFDDFTPERTVFQRTPGNIPESLPDIATFKP